MIQTQTKTTKYVYNLNFSMQFLINFMHTDTQELKFPQKLLINFTLYHF